ncbi:MAG: response regulator transcription factor [Candidatus Cryptobacteroides sp.]
MEIMIVDDEADIREILAFNLSAAGYSTVECGTAEAALAQIRKGHVPDLLLLDIMLPGMSGFKLSDTLRKVDGCQVPIIFLTARGSENDLLTGFSAGGDDYICKPFSINEVLARVKAVLKRCSGEHTNPSTIVLGSLSIDTSLKTVSVDGTPVQLSKKEYEILHLLCINRGRTFSRADLIGELWKDAPYVLERTVDVHIARIRAKLGPCRDMLVNRSGFGYSIDYNE